MGRGLRYHLPRQMLTFCPLYLLDSAVICLVSGGGRVMISAPHWDAHTRMKLGCPRAVVYCRDTGKCLFTPSKDRPKKALLWTTDFAVTTLGEHR